MLTILKFKLTFLQNRNDSYYNMGGLTRKENFNRISSIKDIPTMSSIRLRSFLNKHNFKDINVLKKIEDIRIRNIKFETQDYIKTINP